MAQQLDTFEQTIRKTLGCAYWLYLPEDYDGDGDLGWPLLLFLHGKGERGHADSVKRHGPPKHIENGAAYPFIVLSPICPLESWWDPETLATLLDHVCGDHRVDPDRIYVTGLSMGGFGTWGLGLAFPDRFAAIAPICGGGSPYLADRIAHLPVWAFHGAKDSVVPLYESQRMIDALERCGARPKFTIYADAGHDAWTEAYTDTELTDWLLQHRRA